MSLSAQGGPLNAGRQCRPSQRGGTGPASSPATPVRIDCPPPDLAAVTTTTFEEGPTTAMVCISADGSKDAYWAPSAGSSTINPDGSGQRLSGEHGQGGHGAIRELPHSALKAAACSGSPASAPIHRMNSEAATRGQLADREARWFRRWDERGPHGLLPGLFLGMCPKDVAGHERFVHSATTGSSRGGRSSSAR